MPNTARRKIVVALLTLFMAINFADKAVVGLAASRIMHDLGLRPEAFGLVGSSFFLFFSLTAMLVGFLANHVRSHRIILGMALVWAVAQLPVGLMASLPVLFGSRILLGAGEGPAYPMALHAAFTWFSDKERNMPAFVIQQGASIGLVLAGPILTFIIVHQSWQAAFLWLAAVGAIWAAVWAVAGGDGEDVGATAPAHASEGELQIGTARLLTDPTSIALILVYFMEYASLALFFTWLPAYLHTGLGFSESTAGWLFASVSLSWICGNFVLARITQSLMSAGFSTRLARAVICAATASLGGVLFLVLGTGSFSPAVKFVLGGLGGRRGQTIFLYGPLLLGEIAPANKRGGAFGVLSAIGTLGGVVAPYAMGHVVQTTAGSAAAGFERGYFLVGLMLIVVGAIGIAFIDPARSRARFARRLSLESAYTAAGSP